MLDLHLARLKSLKISSGFFRRLADLCNRIHARYFDFKIFALLCSGKRKPSKNPNLLPMHAYFRNHQLYLAERSDWLDRHVTKTSQRALMKIESWKLIAQAGDGDNQLRLVEKLLKDSLLTPVSGQTILHKEGFFLSNLDN